MARTGPRRASARSAARAVAEGPRGPDGPVTGRLTPRPGGPARLRALLESGETIVAPGAFDPLAARLVEEAGFPAVYMTGFGTSAALLGRPDVGLLTMTEMADNARRIADCVDIPVIADADTGYGNALNVIRTVGAYEAAGVAAIHLEDQVAPKKCGHMDGKMVIPAGEMAQKIRAAVAARTRPDFVIIARTDARAVEGLERALDRARLYREAGADALFIEAVMSQDEAAEAARAFPDVPLLFNWAEGGKTPPISLDRLRELGYRIVIFPISTLLAATAAMRRILGEIARSGTPRPSWPTCRRSGSSWTSSACPRYGRRSSGTPPPIRRRSLPASPLSPPAAGSGSLRTGLMGAGGMRIAAADRPAHGKRATRRQHGHRPLSPVRICNCSRSRPGPGGRAGRPGVPGGPQRSRPAPRPACPTGTGPP